jgi:hypothetical protein
MSLLHLYLSFPPYIKLLGGKCLTYYGTEGIFPTIRRAISLAMAGLKNTAVRGYVYHLVFPTPRPRWAAIVAYYARNPNRLATHKWAWYATRCFNSQGLLTTDLMLIDVRRHNADHPKTTVKGWCDIIAEAKTNLTNEVFCHPGYMDGGYCGSYTYHREREIMALTSDEVKRAIETAKVTLCGYSAIWKE